MAHQIALKASLPHASGPGGLARITQGRGSAALALAIVLFAVVATLDFTTDYEIRLSVLYLLPIALVTWARGRIVGYVFVAGALSSWLGSFHEISHGGLQIMYFVWDGIVMAAVFVVFVELLTRLRSALARADARFLHVLEELFDGVYVVDPASGRILYANRRFASIVGEDPLQLAAVSLAQRFVAEGIQSSVTSCRGDGAPFTVSEVRDAITGSCYLRQSGAISWLGGTTATLCVVTDISARKDAELAQHRLEESAHHTARLAALGEVAATLTHEINQPLTAISTYLNAIVRLRDSNALESAEFRGAMEACRDQALRAGRIVNRMRDFIRRRRLDVRRCDVRDVIAEAVKLTQGDAHGAGITVNLVDELRSPTIRADRVMLVQVLVNLVQNAIDAMRAAGAPQRQLTITARSNDDGRIRVTVADNGEGVPVAIRERLFEPFCTTKPDGIGLGLSICRTILQAHSGLLWHEPLPARGSAFHFELPGFRA